MFGFAGRFSSFHGSDGSTLFGCRRLNLQHVAIRQQEKDQEGEMNRRDDELKQDDPDKSHHRLVPCLYRSLESEDKGKQVHRKQYQASL